MQDAGLPEETMSAVIIIISGYQVFWIEVEEERSDFRYQMQFMCRARIISRGSGRYNRHYGHFKFLHTDTINYSKEVRPAVSITFR